MLSTRTPSEIDESFLLYAAGKADRDTYSTSLRSDHDAPSADGASDVHGCASRTFYCPACDAGSFCSSSCPDLTCPTASEASGAGGARDAASADDAAALGDANRVGGNACPSDKSSSCDDCSGGRHCVSGGCPVTTCPVRDAGGGALPPVDGAGDVRSDSKTTGIDGGLGRPLCPGASAPPEA